MSDRQPATDKELDEAHMLVMARAQLEDAHSVLDDLGIPRGHGASKWTVAGRLAWLRNHTRTESGHDASNDHLCLEWQARWNPNHVEIGPTWEPVPS